VAHALGFLGKSRIALLSEGRAEDGGERQSAPGDLRQSSIDNA
jgi:hypothetical protein